MNTYDLLMKHADETGWNNDSKLRVLCDFLDELDLLDDKAKENISDTLDTYLGARAEEEMEHGHLLGPALRK